MHGVYIAETKYDEICMMLREKMEDRTYAFQELLSLESTLVKEFGCSRNTVRQAIGQLASERYIQSIHGRGVRVIHRPEQQQSEFILGDIENLKEAMVRSRRNYTTKMVCSTELTVDETIHGQTTSLMGAQTHYIQRVRCIEGETLIIDRNYFLEDVVRDPMPGIAERSIYEYMGNDLGGNAVTTKRKMTVKCVDQIDKKYLDLKGYNCMAMVSSMTYNKEGAVFELIQSRRRPDRFVSHDLAHRTRQVN